LSLQSSEHGAFRRLLQGYPSPPSCAAGVFCLGNYLFYNNAIPLGLQLQKACRAVILMAHGVSRGLSETSLIPEAQDDCMDESAFASGMKTDLPPSQMLSDHLISLRMAKQLFKGLD
jgi:hypothetical protein